jgi:hypothetical protein
MLSVGRQVLILLITRENTSAGFMPGREKGVLVACRRVLRALAPMDEFPKPDIPRIRRVFACKHTAIPIAPIRQY